MPSDEEYEEPSERGGSEGAGDQGSNPEEEEEIRDDAQPDSDEDGDEVTATPKIIVRGRGRGRPRGRPRGSGRGGRGRGGSSTRAGRRSGLSITLKNPNYNPTMAHSGTPDDGSLREGDDSGVGTPARDMQDGDGGTKMYREIGGVRYEFTGEDLVLPEDPAGETKIDSLGRLQGGRIFKGAAFTSTSRPNPERMYMLSIEAARATGYRDSLYYFRRNPLLVKLTLTQGEKDILIERKILSQNLKSRIVTMVTAKTAFMVGGAKMIRDGKWVSDDYYEDKAREECLAKGIKPGDPVGEVGDITFGDRDPDANRNKTLQAVTTSDRSSTVYKAGGPTTFFGGAGQGPFAGEMSSSKRAALSRDGVTEENWMAIAAASILEANEAYAKMRKARLEHGTSGTHSVGAGGKLNSGGVPNAETLAPHLRGLGRLLPQHPTPAGTVTVSKDRPRLLNEEPQPISTAGLSQAALKALNIKRPGFNEDGSPVQRKKVKIEVDNRVKGIYEPHTGLIHYRTSSQPTRSRIERLPAEDSAEKTVFGGTNIGSNAWGIAWVDTHAEYRDYEAEKEVDLRNQLEATSLS